MYRATTTLILLSEALLADIVLPVQAQQAAHNPAEVQAGEFAIDPDHTQIGFTLSHMGFPLKKTYTIGLDAVGTVKRSEFGVTKYVPLIGDEVDLSLHGVFEKK